MSNNYIENESNGDKNKTLSVENYLNKIKQNLNDILNDHKKSDTWKVQLTISVHLISFNDKDEENVLHSKNDNIEILNNDELEQVIEELFQSLLSGNKIGTEISMRGTNFIFNCVHLFHYTYHKTNFKWSRLHIDSPKNSINKKYN